MELVTRLLRAQAPSLADRRPVFEAEGWDNVMFRLGDDLAVRLPRRQLGADLLAVEQRWLETAAAGIGLEVPRHVVIGAPAEGYPWPWSVVTWIAGEAADEEPSGSAQMAGLADALTALHRPAPDDAPISPFRGSPLEGRRDAAEARAARVSELNPEAGRTLWTAWREAAELPAPAPARWIHGDLHPGNLIVRAGRLVGIIDWGDLGAGDPATDLAVAYHLLEDPGDRHAFLNACGADGQTRLRARGWAAHIALALYEAGDPRHDELARRITRRLRQELRPR